MKQLSLIFIPATSGEPCPPGSRDIFGAPLKAFHPVSCIPVAINGKLLRQPKPADVLADFEALPPPGAGRADDDFPRRVRA